MAKEMGLVPEYSIASSPLGSESVNKPSFCLIKTVFDANSLIVPFISVLIVQGSPAKLLILINFVNSHDSGNFITSNYTPMD